MRFPPTFVDMIYIVIISTKFDQKFNLEEIEMTIKNFNSQIILPNLVKNLINLLMDMCVCVCI